LKGELEKDKQDEYWMVSDLFNIPNGSFRNKIGYICILFSEQIMYDNSNKFLWRRQKIMISYTTTCIICKQDFELIEGTKKYKERKKDRDKKFWCDECEGKINSQARKGFLERY